MPSTPKKLGMTNLKCTKIKKYKFMPIVRKRNQIVLFRQNQYTNHSSFVQTIYSNIIKFFETKKKKTKTILYKHFNSFIK